MDSQPINSPNFNAFADRPEHDINHRLSFLFFELHFLFCFCFICLSSLQLLHLSCCRGDPLAPQEHVATQSDSTRTGLIYFLQRR